MAGRETEARSESGHEEERPLSLCKASLVLQTRNLDPEGGGGEAGSTAAATLSPQIPTQKGR
jgi:hypothetical protein